MKIVSFEERAVSPGSEARAVAFIEIAMDGVPGSVFGAGLHGNSTTAALLALCSAAARAVERRQNVKESVAT